MVAKKGEKQTFTVKGVSFVMIPVRGGTFRMGATAEQKKPKSDEKPVHTVTLSNYSIGETEVTQALWQAVMGSNPSYFKGPDCPVVQVSWDDCQTFIQKLNALTETNFRLPTEAEWEYAARGGNKSQSYQYAGRNKVGSVAWYTKNSGSTMHDVKTKAPNELGIYDMSGNVWEWCQDWYSSTYSSGAVINPQGSASGSGRVCRGGSWHDYNWGCRLAKRNNCAPSLRYSDLGLRLAKEDEKQTFTVNGVSFAMIFVQGGTFQMGATSEQNYSDNEKPVHSVTLSNYSIGETEVTQALWQAVMGANPSYFQGPNRPVEKVSWNDCQTFIQKLNA
jgi:formylglycine-generating enzyme required for sulfatase activity